MASDASPSPSTAETEPSAASEPAALVSDAPPKESSLSAPDVVLMIGGLALFMVLLYVMQVAPGDDRFLSPLLVAAAGAIVLWPVRQMRAARALLLAGGFLLHSSVYQSQASANG